MTAADLKEAIEAWDSDEDTSMSTASRDRMIAVAVELFVDLPGVRKVVAETGTAGSDYIAIIPDHDDACDVTVRLSNHQRKPNGHVAPAWSFEPGDSLKSVEMGLSEVAKAVADEIEQFTS